MAPWGRPSTRTAPLVQSIGMVQPRPLPTPEDVTQTLPLYELQTPLRPPPPIVTKVVLVFDNFSIH